MQVREGSSYAAFLYWGDLACTAVFVVEMMIKVRPPAGGLIDCGLRTWRELGPI